MKTTKTISMHDFKQVYKAFYDTVMGTNYFVKQQVTQASIPCNIVYIPPKYERRLNEKERVLIR
nr:MAG TPA: hypothetical protein [Caudoviricetes sp.]